MKKICFLALCVFLLVLCNRASLACIQRIKTTPASEVALTDQLLVQDLVARAGVEKDKFQAYQLVQLSKPDGSTGIQVVKGNQIVNGIRVMNGWAALHFMEGKLNMIDGHLIRATDLPPEPQTQLPDVRRLFNQYMDEHHSALPSCADAEPGYYDLNSGISNSDPNLTRAWRVTPQGQRYPLVLIDDISGKLIRYDNGVILD